MLEFCIPGEASAWTVTSTRPSPETASGLELTQPLPTMSAMTSVLTSVLKSVLTLTQPLTLSLTSASLQSDLLTAKLTLTQPLPLMSALSLTSAMTQSLSVGLLSALKPTLILPYLTTP